jgi:PBSX family phage portal protein
MDNAQPIAVQDAAPMPVASLAAGVQAFTFGDPEPVMHRREILDYIECWNNGRWYEPPISFAGLAKSFRASTHHSSAIFFKANVLASTLKRNPYVSRSTMKRLAIDFQVFGNAYPSRVLSVTGKLLGVDAQLAKYVRRGIDMESYFFVPGYGQEHRFDDGTVFQLIDPDINQEVYGLPEYLSTLQSAWLNESATLFRRKYYNNGSHAGFILYMSDASQSQEDIDNVRAAMKNAKGPGNFRNLFIYSPNGKKDGVQVIPVSEVAAKDDFFNIKNVTRDDILAAHRVPPQLMGIVPSNTGGFGAVVPAAEVFAVNEIEPMQTRFTEINEWLGVEAFVFEKYQIEASEKKSA